MSLKPLSGGSPKGHIKIKKSDGTFYWRRTKDAIQKGIVHHKKSPRKKLRGGDLFEIQFNFYDFQFRKAENNERLEMLHNQITRYLYDRIQNLRINWISRNSFVVSFSPTKTNLGIVLNSYVKMFIIQNSSILKSYQVLNVNDVIGDYEPEMYFARDGEQQDREQNMAEGM
jgi:hypothetical protein